MKNTTRPRFAGDIKPKIDDWEAEYVRIARFVDKFLPKEDTVTYKVKLTDSSKATYESVEVIKQLIEQGKRDYVVRRVAEKLVQYIPPKDYLMEVKAIYNFVIRRLRYTKDINKVETVHRARDLMRWHKKAADCDDFVILTGSLLESIGHPVRLVIIGNNKANKEDFSHIYLQVKVRDKWVSLDGSVPGAKVGWEAPKYVTKKVFSLDGSVEEVMPKYLNGIENPPKVLFWIIAVAVGLFLLR